MNDQGKSIVINSDVRLYRQKNSPFWWANVHTGIGQKPYRKSTKVRVDSDPDGRGAARDAALAMVVEIGIKIKNGMPLSERPKFSRVAAIAIARMREKQTQLDIYDRYESALNMYLVPCLGRVSIDKVDRRKLEEFFQWRERQTGAPISRTQLTVTKTALDMVFEVAIDKGYLEYHKKPVLPKVGVKLTNKRVSFNARDLELILDRFDEYIQATKRSRAVQLRTLLNFYSNFLLATGARAGKEVVTLRFSDLEWHKSGQLIIWQARIHKGKLSSRFGERKIILPDRAREALEGLVRWKFGHEVTLLKALRDYAKELIFSYPGESRVPEFSHPFGDYLKYLGLSEKRYSLYTFRHTYITNMLLKNKVSMQVIAKQCGNSIEVIQKNYDHVKPLQYAHVLVSDDMYRSFGTTELTQFFE